MSSLNRIFRSLTRRLRVVRRFVDAMLMMWLLHCWPEKVYRFSTRKLLPSGSDRYRLPESPQVPYEIVDTRSSPELPKFEHLTVVLRGSSFDLQNLDALSDPVALVSFWPKALWPNPYDSEFWPPIKTKREVIYTHFHSEAIRELLNLNLRVLWIEGCYLDRQGNLYPQDGNREEPWYEELACHPLCTRISVLQKIEKGGEPFRLRPPSGSGLAAISVSHMLSETITVYGWDYYLKESPFEMGYWRVFSKLYSYFLDSYKGRNFVEAGIINFYYGYQFAKIPGIKVHSYLGQLCRQKKLIGKLERVLFSPKEIPANEQRFTK